MRKAVLHLKKSDTVLRAIIERIGRCRMEFGEPKFHSLAEAIIYQQLNGKAAVTIFNRFAALAGNPLTPEGILKLTPEQMRGFLPPGHVGARSSWRLELLPLAGHVE